MNDIFVDGLGIIGNNRIVIDRVNVDRDGLHHRSKQIESPLRAVIFRDDFDEKTAARIRGRHVVQTIDIGLKLECQVSTAARCADTWQRLKRTSERSKRI